MQSKQHLDDAVVQDGKVLANKRGDNTPKAILKAIKGLQKQLKGLNLVNTLFCLEHTGIYAYPLLHALKQEEGSIWLEQAIQIQRSLGVERGKSDAVDAQRIALYAYKNRQAVRLWGATSGAQKRFGRTTQGATYAARKIPQYPLEA